MDGVLVVDKPQGVTSHDVVAAARRALDETRIGHTGTLDPLATGVLPLALGRATRLARFLSGTDKEYDATIRFGLTTDTYDITGRETSRTALAPSPGALEGALRTQVGEQLQMPPAYSAKKVRGRRAYQFARADRPVALRAVPVTVHRIDLIEYDAGRARVLLACSAGFYVRSFAHALGERLETGACLEALRRTRSGEFHLGMAVRLEDLGDAALARLVPLSRLLGDLPAVRVTPRGRDHAAHGRAIDAADYRPADLPAAPFGRTAGHDIAAQGPSSPASSRWIRLLDADGTLVGIATDGDRPGALHPSVVLM